ncbi:hypothetical protein B0H17DRAFT_1194114 [Mycena rosella]|uniref:Uncharacterized protein n=1 Tax=Mycena rosella TaxID=1033263 RepID=A0AAD7E146_MYCRO|nr:hypothetical protein B0H17DRAFT_1194114 [Mycena rosella]
MPCPLKFDTPVGRSDAPRSRIKVDTSYGGVLAPLSAPFRRCAQARADISSPGLYSVYSRREWLAAMPSSGKKFPPAGVNSSTLCTEFAPPANPEGIRDAHQRGHAAAV